jgi:hypothetical protein
MTTLRVLILIAIAISAPLARAGQTFVWSGNDSRFTANFTITDAAFDARQFTYSDVSSYSFAFNDPTKLGSAWHLTSTSLSALYPNLFDGSISADGTSLGITPLPQSPNFSFWISAWPVQYNIGIYSYSAANSSTEFIKYIDYTDDTAGQATGTWSHQSLPQTQNVSDHGSMTAALAAVLASLTFVAQVRRRSSARYS